MIDLHFVNQFMYENFERVSISSDGTHFHARCPLCGDSKKSLSKKRFHLDWSPARVVWHCWNCPDDASGNFLQLYARIKGISNSEAYKILHKFDHEDYKKTLKRTNTVGQHKKLTRSDKVHNDILDDCMPYDCDSKISMLTYDALQTFRTKRNISDSQKIYYAYKGKFRNRIIIPIFDKNDNIIYFQGRRLPGTDLQPKYLNPTAEKSLIIHNEPNFDPKKYIIVTEGLLDAFSIGDQGTTCLGKEITKDLLEVLFKKSIGVIIAFDNDKAGMISLRKFMIGNKPWFTGTPSKENRSSFYNWKKPNKYAKQVKYFLMPQRFLQYKDINMLCIEEKISDVYDFICRNSYDYMKTALKLQLEER